MAKERFRETADYTVSAGPDGYCFRFYCAVSGALPCVAGPIRKGSQDTTLETAWQTVAEPFQPVPSMREMGSRCHV